MKIFLSFALLLCGLGAPDAEASKVKAQNSAWTLTQDKVAVRPDDLPEAVKNTLSSDAYAGWQVTSAFLITKEDNSQYFEINAKRGEESTVINLDKYGKKVD